MDIFRNRFSLSMRRSEIGDRSMALLSRAACLRARTVALPDTGFFLKERSMALFESTGTLSKRGTVLSHAGHVAWPPEYREWADVRERRTPASAPLPWPGDTKFRITRPDFSPSK
jgi:hypothetical protein